MEKKKIILIEAPFNEEQFSNYNEQMTKDFPDALFIVKNSEELNLIHFDLQDSENVTLKELEEIVTNWIKK
jgi:hypothetical protein